MLIHAIRSFVQGGGVDVLSLVMQVLATLFVLFFVLPLHEYAHGYVAYRLGDPTAKNQGRLTLNPIASIDPVGALGILLFGIGWAKPVPVNPLNFKDPKKGMAITALAGPVSNVLAGLAGALLLNILLCLQGLIPTQALVILSVFFYYYISINLMLAVFNLLPVPPLDGSRLVAAFLPDRAMYRYYRYERVLVTVLFLILLSGFLDPLLSFLQGHLWNAVIWLADLPFRTLGLF